MPALPARLVTRPEVAEFLDVSLRTIDRLADEGALPAVRIRSGVRFRPEDVEALVAASTVKESACTP